MAARALTLGQFIIQEERKHPEASGEFTSLLSDIALAAKLINREVVRAGLVDILGYTGGENVHGEFGTADDWGGPPAQPPAGTPAGAGAA